MPTEAETSTCQGWRPSATTPRPLPPTPPGPTSACCAPSTPRGTWRQPSPPARAAVLASPPPASTLVVVAGLVHPDLLVEVEAVVALARTEASNT